MVCDVSRTCATIEHVDGRLVVHSKAQPRALTNHTYASSVAFLKSGGSTRGRGSLARFVRAAKASTHADKAPVPAAFKVLESVRIPGYSKWWIVYDPVALEVHFATAHAPLVKTVSLSKALPTCAQGAYALSMDTRVGGPRRLAKLTTEMNQSLVRASLGESKDARARGLVGPVSALSRAIKCAPRQP
jgi:hypothetical protein